MVHFVRCTKTLTTAEVADMFMQEVFRLHGTPLKTISDRDSKFTSDFWLALSDRWGWRCAFSTAYHAQTDGQTERTNRVLEEMLRHFISPQMNDWDRYLPQLEFAYNSSRHNATGKTPFELYTGLNPITPSSTIFERSFKVPAAEIFADVRLLHLHRARMSLEKAKARAKAYYDKSHQTVEYQVNDQVLLKTKHLQLKLPGSKKLAEKYVGPYTIAERIGKVAYRLRLPTNLKIHDVFHVSCLCRFRTTGGPTDKFGRDLNPPAPVQVDGQWEHWVEEILKHRLRLGKIQFLVKWLGYGHEHNSWEPRSILEDTAALESYLLKHPDL
jgi:Chromo (CHRromatin Organisation MOdifier) domain